MTDEEAVSKVYSAIAQINNALDECDKLKIQVELGKPGTTFHVIGMGPGLNDKYTVLSVKRTTVENLSMRANEIREAISGNEQRFAQWTMNRAGSYS